MNKRKVIFGLVAIGIMLLMSLAPLIGHTASEWDKDIILGTDSPATIDDNLLIQFEAVDRLLSNYKVGCALSYTSATTISVAAGEVVCSNSAGTVRKFRSNTSATAVTFANIDTGAEAASTTYFVYALADADATTFTISISLSSSAPTGATYYKKIGSFYF